MKEFVLALDLGTSSVRAAVFDVRGVRVAGSLVQEAYPLDTSTDGRATLEPGTLLKAARACLEGTLQHVPPGGHWIGTGVTCFWHSLLGLDRAGKPLTPVITWADARCREDAATLRDELSERQIHRETGCMLRASFWPAKLRWLRRTDPERFRKVVSWVSPAEWIQWKLTGQRQCGLGMATGTGLLDPTLQSWSGRMLDVCKLKAGQLFALNDSSMAWKNVPMFPAIGDGAASNLGSQCEGRESGAINVGTSAALRVIRSGKKASAPLGLFAYRVDAVRYLVGGAVSNAGNLRAWCLRELNLPSDPAAVEAALNHNPSAGEGLVVLPSWTAERAPDWKEEATGVVAGFTQATTALDLLSAITDASYLRMGEIARRIPNGDQVNWLVSGGILKSRRALQRLAAALGRPVFKNPEPEATLRGAAVFALEKLGRTPALLKPGRPVFPNPRDIERFDNAWSRMQALDARLFGKK